MAEQEKTGKFLPAFFVDVVEKGQTFPAGELPRHITLFPPLQTPYNHEEMGSMLKYQFNPEIPFTAMVGDNDFFGPENDIPVQRTESPNLERIHNRLVSVLGTLLHDPTFRRPYNPHITVVGDSLEKGQLIPVAGFSIIERRRDTLESWVVADKIGFKGDL